MSFTERLALSLQGSLASGDLWIAWLAAFAGGLLTAFTPCVYPLIPITIRYFGGMQRAGRRYVLSRAAVYVAGMIVLYATLGTAFASMKLVFGSFLASPWVLGAIAIFCVAMGASMLGAFSLQLPSGVQTRLSQVGGRGLGGALLMGIVSGLIAAPCTGPVLAVILALIAASGAVTVGFTLMVAFAVGLGLPFLLLAVSSGALARLPSSGGWMELVKIVLAAAMFVVAAYFLALARPGLGVGLAGVAWARWAGVALGIAGVGAAVWFVRHAAAARAAALKTAAVLLLTAGASLALLGGDSEAPSPAERSDSGAIAWITAHDVGLARAHELGRPVMIDFTAEWCQACKELDRETYVDASVRREAERFVSLKLDATEIDEPMQKLFDRYEVLGLPTVVFIDSRGEVLREPRVTGFVPPKRFIELMEKVR